VGILFSKNNKKRIGSCGSITKKVDKDPCLSQQAGICPVTDTTGALKMVNKNRLDR
jgi:hypothetical protein